MKRKLLTMLLVLAIACVYAGALSACGNKGQIRVAEEQTQEPGGKAPEPTEEAPEPTKEAPEPTNEAPEPTKEAPEPTNEAPEPEEETATYETFPDVPDFGAIADIDPISTTENSYGYLVSDDNADDVTRYDEALREKGFLLISKQEADDGLPILFYDNGEHTVVWGVSEIGSLLIMIEDSVVSSASAAARGESDPKSSTATTGEKNALKSAKSYIEHSDFSRQGLIEQLEFEGYTSSEAVYGADNCGADWYAEAAGSAAGYLEFSSFSRTGLIEQLEFEGFTHDQAVYGVEQNGY